jgi:hypothetical protein
LAGPAKKGENRMPKDFEDCVKNGGKTRTKKLKNGKYIKICYDKNGNSFSGEVHTKKKSSGNKQIDDAKILQKKLEELRDHFNTNFHHN